MNKALVVSIDDQTLEVIGDGKLDRRFPVSTAAKGMGFENGSYRTPTGRFYISDKIGEGMPAGTIFKSREPQGLWQPEDTAACDLVLSRILRLEGIDPENSNTRDRYIYIHGTNHEDQLGTPASHGCVRLANADMIELFDLVEVGTPLEILPATKRRGKLLFLDCDSTLSSIEGIDELGRSRGDEVFARVVALTDAAMNGEIPINEVFPSRMNMIRPDRQLCGAVAEKYIQTVVPGAAEMIRAIKADGWLPVILSGGFAPLIMPLAKLLGIDHVEAVPLHFHADGSYKGYGDTYPTTRNLGKNEIIRTWKEAMLPERVVMVGDGMSDLETKPEVDCFIGFGGVVSRPLVMAGCDHWLTDMSDIDHFLNIISSPLR